MSMLNAVNSLINILTIRKRFLIFLLIFCTMLALYMLILKPNNKVQTKFNFEKETTVLRWSGNTWRTVNRFCSKDYNFDSSILKSPAGDVKIYVHPFKDDLFVSVSLRDSGTWDKQGLDLMFEELDSDPDMALLDFGAHLGTFALTAARMGRKVIAVDPLVENVIRLCRSVQRNGLVDYVTVVFAALSDYHKKMAVRRRIGNLGGTHVEETDSNVEKVKYPRHQIEAVPADELLSVIDFQKVFIKLDVETHEYFVLKGGNLLFQRLDVQGILMEWEYYRTGHYGKEIIDFLTRKQFVPYSVDWKGHQLDIRYYSSWPFNVFWKKEIKR